MVSFAYFRDLAMSFPEVREEPHFEKFSFRVRKKIFATYDAKRRRACFKLSVIDQDVFGMACKTAIYPVPNKWGMQGWTFIDLETIPEDIFTHALRNAYIEVAPRQLSVAVRQPGT